VRSGISEHQEALDMYAGHPGGTLDNLVAAGRSYGILRGSTFMQPDTIANAALFLNSELASHVTGISVPVESGHLLIPGINTEPVIVE
jgi:enoyl-[acyl-carrier-protein] reductase (NADH)